MYRITEVIFAKFLNRNFFHNFYRRNQLELDKYNYLKTSCSLKKLTTGFAINESVQLKFC